MKTESFKIAELDLEAFKDACRSVSVNFLYYDNGVAVIEYNYCHSLFFLGRQLELAKRLIELKS